MRFFYFVLTSSLLILAVLAVRGLFRKKLSPVVLYALWLFPVVRLMAPFGMMELSGGGIGTQLLTMPYTVLEEMASRLEEEADPEDQGGIVPDSSYEPAEEKAIFPGASPAADEGLLSEKTTGTLPEQGLQGVQVPDVEKAAKVEHFRLNGWQMFLAVWICVCVVIGAYVLFSNRRLMRSVRHMDIERKDCPLPVCFSNAVVSPCLFGVVRPYILVNRRVQEDPELFRQVLRHETAHYRQKDHIWTALRILLCIVYWWNPLVWLAAACAKEDAELSCDYLATRNMDVQEKKAYGMALLTLLARSNGGLTLLYGATSMSGEARGMKRRIREIANRTVTDRAVLLPLLAALTALLLAGCSVRDTSSYMKVVETGTEQGEDGNLVYTAQWEYSYQEPLQHRLYYYEEYQYGSLTDRHLLAVGNIGDDRKAALGLGLEEGMGPEKSLVVHFDWGGASSACPVGLEGVVSDFSGNDMNQEGIKYDIQPGDDLILAAQYFAGASEDTLEVISCESLMEYAKEGRLEEQLSDTYMVVLVRCILSQESLSEQFTRTMEYPGESSEETSPTEELAEKWALAFSGRDGSQLASLMSEDLKASMLDHTEGEEDALFLESEDETYYFGWSSPWPMDGEDSYRVEMSEDGQSADIFYYAWDSTPHIYVWKESLEFEEADGEWKVSSQDIQYFTDISTREEFYEAYPQGVIDGTPMDYQSNGFGAVLNDHAISRPEETYTRLLEPMKAAEDLLNLENVSIQLTALPTEGAVRSVPVEVTFLEDGSVVNFWMYQPPYDPMGLWIPASSDPNADGEEADAGKEAPSSEPLPEEELDPESGYRMAVLTYVEPEWARQYTDLSGWDEERLENGAQKALQELYDLTGWQVEECVYASTGNGDYTFAKTAEDMEHSRIFYSRQFHNEKYENTIPSIYLASARRVWYSDVQQLIFPEDVADMTGEELARWYLERSCLYQEGIDPAVERVELMNSADETYRMILSDGTFYEIALDQKINGVNSIYGPYPEGFEH